MRRYPYRYGFGYGFRMFRFFSKIVGALTIAIILAGIALWAWVDGNGPSTSPAGAAISTSAKGQ